MSLITKDHLSLTLKTIKSLLSFKADKIELATKADKIELYNKADKAELATKIDRSEFEEEDAIAIVAELGLVSPVAASDGSIYTDKNGVIYTL